jgi:hypothetical protein
MGNCLNMPLCPFHLLPLSTFADVGLGGEVGTYLGTYGCRDVWRRTTTGPLYSAAWVPTEKEAPNTTIQQARQSHGLRGNNLLQLILRAVSSESISARGQSRRKLSRERRCDMI